MDTIESLIEIYGEGGGSRYFNETIKLFTLDIFKNLLGNFVIFASELNYYKTILRFFRSFGKEIKEQVNVDLIGKFIKALYNKTGEEIGLCSNDPEILKDSTSVKSCLEIFVELCRDERVHKSFHKDIDIILEDYCRSLLKVASKDNIILDYMFELLKGNYELNKELSSCHEKFIKEYILDLRPNHGLTGPLFNLLNLYSVHGFYDIHSSIKDNFIKKMLQLAISSIKEGYRKAHKMKVTTGMLMLQNIIQVF